MDAGLYFTILSPMVSSIAVIFQSNAVKLLHPLIVANFGTLIGPLTLFIIILVSREKIDSKKIKANSLITSFMITREHFSKENSNKAH